MKRTKSALLKSALALFLCVSMLIGSTFAWFTDSVTSGGNIIQSGTLDLEMYWTDDLSSNVWHDVEDDAHNTIFSYDNWEPGYTDVKYIKLVNKGNLALNYKLTLTPVGSVGKLAEVINVFFANEAVDVQTRADLSRLGAIGLLNNVLDGGATASGTLLAAGQQNGVDPSGEIIVTLAMNMLTTAGNEYQAEDSGEFTITALATQASFEEDSFDADYDSNAEFPAIITGDSISVPVTAVDGKVPAGGVTMAGENISAFVPAGAKMAAGAEQLTLTVTPLEHTTSDVTALQNEILTPVDVHISGLAADNTVPVIIDLGEVLPKYLNMGNYRLYHVENGADALMTLVDSEAELTAHNRFTYDPLTGVVKVAMATFSEVTLIADTTKAWEGKRDYTWYDASKTELTIANADQLAAFGAIVGGMDKKTQDSFKGKTVKLLSNINLGDSEKENNPDIIFYPIGYYNSEGTYERTNTAITSGLYPFEGTFDGNGHTVANFYQNTWEMKGDHNWYAPEDQYYRDGMGLFGKVYGGIVKNLTIQNFSSDGEIATTGCVAAYADGAAFENIAIFNCNPRVYNIGNGGIVGCVGWYAKEAGLKTTFQNITVDNSNKISALWGSYDVACGGVVGQYYPTSGQTSVDSPKNGGVEFENCHISAQMDVYNDVCANYQYYAYRYTGMLIGSVRENETIGGHSYPKMDGITAKDCTVHFGDWNDYYYCELVANSLASYTHDHQFSRLEQIQAVDGIEVTYLDGTKETVTGTRNFVVVNGEHASENATCYHFKNGEVYNHADAGTETVGGVEVLKEDKQHIYLEFNNLVTGYGWGVTTKGVGDLDGVTILDREVADSAQKFASNITVNTLYNGKGYTIAELFKEKDNNTVDIMNGKVQVTVSPVGDDSTVTGTYVANTTDWTKGTLTLSGTGAATITITDYYFCTPTTITVTVTERQPEVKFETKFTGDFLYRVGNADKSTVALGTLFTGTNVTGTVTVSIKTVAGNASGAYTPKDTWENGTIQFTGTGVVKVTITDNDYCTPTELNLEVVDAVNATGATSATSSNVVLLQNCGFSSLTVSDGYTLYGNGFTLTCSQDSYALDMGYAFVNLENGTLDNVQIVTPNFDYAVLYKSNMTESGNRNYTDANGTTRYYNVKSGVMASGNSQILNSRISGARAAVNVSGGNCLIDNSRIEGGAVASVLVGAANSLTLRDVTLVQKPTASTYDPTKTLMGFSVLVICNADGSSASINLEGTLIQNAWVDENDKQYVPSAGQSIITDALKQTDYLHDIDGDGTNESLNLGFAYMPQSANGKVETSNIVDNRANKTAVPYDFADVSTTKVYSYKNTNGTDSSIKEESKYEPNKQGDIITVTYGDTADGLESGKTFGTSGWVYELNVDLDKLAGYALDFSKLSMSVNGTTVTDFTVNGAAKPTSPVEVTAGGTEYTLTTTVDGKEHTAIFKVTGTETTKESPSLVASNYEAALLVGEAGNTLTKDTWHGAAPALEGIQIKYWSVAEKQYKTIKLSDYTPTTAGKQNGSNTTWTYSPDNGDFTLTLTGGQVHSSNNVSAIPVVVGTKLYFVSATSSGLVNYGNSARTIPVTYSFKDNNGGTELTFSHTWSIECANGNTAYDYSDFMNGTSKTFTIKSSNGNVCVTGDTLVALKDGTQKRIDKVTYEDQLLVWNFFTGQYDVAPASIIFNHGKDNYDVLKLLFSDGTSVKVLNNHGFFSVAENAFVFIDEKNVASYVGYEFVKTNEDGTSAVTLVAYETYCDYVDSYSIQSAMYNNFMVEGMFSITMPAIEGWFDYFEIGEGMKYDEAKMQADIEKYGLYDYSEFAEYVTYEQFIAFNGPYLKVLVGRGVLTFEQIFELIATYVNP